MLSSGLSEFSRWARQKLQLVEEDIDVCRIVYTLHGSLSQVENYRKQRNAPFKHIPGVP